ncbi:MULTISPECIES: hypothetical protein [Streptomyces]|uniref:hypothetical protein n=1 Tax=Streptomyces TaxID=1883 RepID=UPI000F73ABD6|nr:MULTISPECIES: hypothetical protein [Streptomyces]RSS03873.1 hypothetical protein EF917_12270 [Streptomyces sp. WAC00469]GGV78511.1 hypothetical protein GCM10010499_39000 [Streptomyces thermoviolaceus subsp. apingens]
MHRDCGRGRNPAATGDGHGPAAHLLHSPLLIVRNLALPQRLLPRTWATIFSVLHAAAGAGYGTAGLAAAALLHVTGSAPAFAACALITLVIGSLALLGERLLHRPTGRRLTADG